MKYGWLTLAAACWAAAADGYAQTALFPDARDTPARTVCADGGNNETPCYFDVSFTLTEGLPAGSDPFLTDAIAWDPRDDDNVISLIEKEMKDFAEDWCVATAGLSKINRITLYTDGRAGDFRLINGIGRGEAEVGRFQIFRPSGVLYRYGQNRSPGEVVHDGLGAVAAHELAHSALKLYDEYVGGIETSSACANPLSKDDARATIMNDHNVWKRFSVADDYAPPSLEDRTIPQTAQYRCYETSAWQTLTRPVTQDPLQSRLINDTEQRKQFFNAIPEGILERDQTASAWGCGVGASELNELVVWAPDARRVVMLIDRSGSMTGVDERTGKDAITAAKDAAKRIVSSVAVENRPIQVAVVEFGENTFPRVGLTLLGNQIYRDEDEAYQLRVNEITGYDESGSYRPGRIDEITPRGGTDFQAGLDGVRTLLADAGQNDEQAVVIMLTDGQDDPPDVSYFRDSDIPIYTVGIGQLDPGVLRGIAQDTGGEYHVPETLDEIEEIFLRILYGASIVSNNQMVVSGKRLFSAPEAEPASDSGQTTFESVISGLSETANFILTWDDGAVLESFTLTRPDGVVIDRAYARSTTTVGYLQTAFQAAYSVQFPERGVWTANVRGSGEFEYDVLASSLITADLNAGAKLLRGAAVQEAVTYPEPIPIIATIHGVKPIVRANAVAEVTLPDGSTVTLTLRDDGEAPDGAAHDGTYSGVLGDYDLDGVYRVEVIINNPEGTAKFGEEGVPPDSLMRAPPFQRVVRGRVEVAGVSGKHAPAPTPDNPVETTPDGSVHWGALERLGQENWYRFNAHAEKKYYVQTSNLMGYDGVEMATGLTLYEHDGATAVGYSAYYRGSNVSSIEWVASADGAYFVSVAHADEGRGVYALTLNERNLLSEHALELAARSGGGSADYVLLLSLIAALLAAAFSRRRRHHPPR